MILFKRFNFLLISHKSNLKQYFVDFTIFYPNCQINSMLTQIIQTMIFTICYR